MEGFLNAEELAQRLRVTTATIHAWHRRGLIPGRRAGQRPVLFDPTEVDEALQGNDKTTPLRSQPFAATDIQQKWLFCPWCGCRFPSGVTADNGCDACRGRNQSPDGV